MNIVDVNKLESVIICFDWERMVIPREYVKSLEYDGKKFSDNVVLEIDLDYIKTHKYFMGNDFDYYQKNNIESDSDLTIWERLQYRDVWNIDVVYKDKKVEIGLPSNRKDFYCHGSQYIMAWDAVNECEVHSVCDGVFKITWSKNDVYMNEEELKLFLVNDNLSQRVLHNVAFGTRLLENLFKDNFSNLTKAQLQENHERIDNVEVNVLTLNKGMKVNLVLVTNEEEKNVIDKFVRKDKKYWVLILNDKLKGKIYNEDNVAVIGYKDFNKLWLDFKEDDFL